MPVTLIPQPRKLVYTGGSYRLPRRAVIAIADVSLHAAARLTAARLGRAAIRADAGPNPTIAIRFRRCRRPDSYRLNISHDGIVIEAASPTGAFYAVQTFTQLLSQASNRALPCLRINDSADFEKRGIYYDLARGRVPALDSLKRQADLLAHYKINELQYYIEHTFRFAGHPAIGRGASPLTPDDVLELDRYCRARHIELVPSLASFGHLAPILTLPRYRHLAEDLGVGQYCDPAAGALPAWQRRRGWSLAPANPATYKFLDSLFSEFLPLFSSKRFNVCCDETWDLGLGQSYRLCKQRGKGRVYLDHLLRVRELAGKHGKSIMFWGDIIRQHPKLIGDIPDDVTVLDWGYDHTHDFAAIRDFRKAGLDFYACPGTSSWNSLFPRWPQSVVNIHGFAAAGKRNGAQGLLTTDWGDGGHYNFMEYSWPGYVFAAEQAWNTSADTRDFVKRFFSLFMNSSDASLRNAFVELGDISQLMVHGNSHVWQRILFAEIDDDIFSAEPREAWTAVRGKLSRKRIRLDKRIARKTIDRLEPVRAAFKRRAPDPAGVLPYWSFAADTIAAAALKLELFACGAVPTARQARLLKGRIKSLARRFEKLWLARNRKSQIDMTLRRYRRAMDTL